MNKLFKIFTGIFISALIGGSVCFSNLAEGWDAEITEYGFHLSGLIGCFYVFMLYIRSSTARWQGSIIDLFVLITALYIIVRQLAIGIGGLQNDYIFTLSVLFFTYIALRILLATRFEQTIYLLFAGIALCCVAEILLGAYQVISNFKSQGFTRPVGTFTNSGVYAGYLTATLPGLFFVVYIFKKWFAGYKKTFYALNIILFIIALSLLTLTQARASLTAFVVTIILVYGRDLYKKIIQAHKLLQFFAVCFTVAAITYAGWLFLTKQNSATGRLLIWENCFYLIKDAPVFGKGIGGFAKEYMLYQAAYFSQNPQSKYLLLGDDNVFAFNELLQLAAELGIIGVMLFSAIFVFSIKIIRHTCKANYAFPFTKGLLMILGILLFSSLFTYTFHCTGNIVILTIVLAAVASLDSNAKTVNGPGFPLIICIVFTSVPGLFTCFQMLGTFYWKKGIDNILERESYALAQYERAKKYIGHRNIFLFNYGSTLYETGHYAEAANILQKTEKYKNDALLCMYMGKIYELEKEYIMAEKYYLLAGNMVPKLFYPKLYLMELYRNTGNVSAAKKMAEIIVEFPVKIPSEEVFGIRAKAKKYLDSL